MRVTIKEADEDDPNALMIDENKDGCELIVVNQFGGTTYTLLDMQQAGHLRNMLSKWMQEERQRMQRLERNRLQEKKKSQIPLIK